MFSLLRQKISDFINKTKEAAESEEKKDEVETEKELKLTAGTRIKSIITRKIKFTEKDLDGVLWDLQLDLIQSDVAVETVDSITQKLREKLIDKEVDLNEIQVHIKNTLREILLEILTPEKEVNLIKLIKARKDKSETPFKIVFFGVNGTGKTTTIAKVAHYLMKHNLSVVLAAGDTFRAGAIEQLETHGERLGLKVVSHQKGADSAAVIYDAVEHAKAKKIDVVLADTAGRMQTNTNLMDEMEKICRVIKPDLRIFVGDALTGNDSIEQAREFSRKVGIDAAILSKMDADAKGGSALSITHETRKPVIFIGVGQQYSDLREFDRNWFVENVV